MVLHFLNEIITHKMLYKNLGPLKNFASNSKKLYFYALYKQATLGPCETSKPAFWNIIEKYKWSVFF